MKATDRQRILVIDDDQDLPRLLTRTLELEGYDTIVVSDADVAGRLMEKLTPDLVILDADSSGADNLPVLDTVRRHSEAPIIVLSTVYEPERLREAIKHGADDLVRKPFVTRLLVARIKAILRRAIHGKHQPQLS